MPLHNAKVSSEGVPMIVALPKESTMSIHETEQAQRRRDDRDVASEAVTAEKKSHEAPTTKRAPGAHSKLPNTTTAKSGGVSTPSSGSPTAKVGSSSRASRRRNNVRKLRTERMMSKAELARRAGLSTLTIDRVEKGMPCRMDTKRKILEALGLTPSDRVSVFGEDD